MNNSYQYHALKITNQFVQSADPLDIEVGRLWDSATVHIIGKMTVIASRNVETNFRADSAVVQLITIL